MAENSPDTHPQVDPKKRKIEFQNFKQIEAFANSTATQKPLKLKELPPKYDHGLGQLAYESPEADATLSHIRDRFSDGQKPTIFDLLRFVQDESEDIRNQQKVYEHEHPEWIYQKALVATAKEYFSLPLSKDEEEVVISSDPILGKKTMFHIGRRQGMEAIVIKRDTINSNYNSTHSFEDALTKNKRIEKALLEISVGNFPDHADRKEIHKYLWWQKRRWGTRQTEAKTDEERILAKQNEDIFDYLIDNPHKTLKFGEAVEKEAQKIVDDSWKEESLKEAADIIDNTIQRNRVLLTEAENIAHGTVPKEIISEAEKIVSDASQKADREKPQKHPTRRFFFRKK